MIKFTEFWKSFLEGKTLPSNKRSRLLLEAQYIFPASGDTAIMDLYALYTLWWEFGAGKDDKPYPQTEIRNHKITERVNRLFEEALTIIGRKLLKETQDAIADEVENVFDPHLVNSQSVYKWVKSQGEHFLPKFSGAYNGGLYGQWFKFFTYNETIHIFGASFWKEDADLYGGTQWARITEATRNLDAALRRENTENLMGKIDALLDLDHNTGSLSAKLTQMKVDKKTLDLRAGFETARDFKPYVSPQVAGLIR